MASVSSPGWSGSFAEVSLLDARFGVKGDGTTDDWAAITTVIQALGSTADPSGTTIRVPSFNADGTSRVYRLSKALHINRGVTLVGEGGMPWYRGATFKFDVGVHGVIVDSAYEPSRNSGYGDFSRIENIAITTAPGQTPRVVTDGVSTANSTTFTSATANFTSGDVGKAIIVTGANDGNTTAIRGGSTIVSVTNSTTVVLSDPAYFSATGLWTAIRAGCGLVMNGKATADHCVITTFPGHGVDINTTVPYTNANGWHLDTVWVQGVGGHGFQIRGHDSNAGTGDSCGAFTCGGYGFLDCSALGNTYDACETSTCTLGGYAAFGGSAYNVFDGCYMEGDALGTRIIGPNVVIGGVVTSFGEWPDSIAKSTRISPTTQGYALTTPLRGLSNSIDTYTAAASITAGSHTLVVTGANFASADIGAHIFVMGAGTVGWGGTVGYLVATITAVTNSTTVTIDTAATTAVSGADAYIDRFLSGYFQVGGDNGSNVAAKWGVSARGSRGNSGIAELQLTYTPDPTYGNWFNFATSGFSAPLRISVGSSAVPAGIVNFSNGFMLGYSTDLTFKGQAAAAPTTGTWRQGDWLWNTAPTVAGTMAWACTTAGTPGTWTTIPMPSAGGGSTGLDAAGNFSIQVLHPVAADDPNLIVSLSGGGQRGLQVDDGTATAGNPLFWVTTSGNQTKLSVAADGTVGVGTLKSLTSGNETTGAGSAALGANCPAVTATAPFKWLKALLSDGSTVFIPTWK